MKKTSIALVICILLTFLLVNTASSEGQRVYLTEIDLSITFPTDYLVFTQNMDDNDPLLVSAGLTAAETSESLASVLHNAEAYSIDDANIMIYVNSSYNTITDFSNLSDYMLDTMAETLKDVNESYGCRIEDYQWYEVNGRKYLVMDEKYFGISDDCYAYQYFTIHKNMAYNFVLVNYTGKVTDSEREIMQAIVDSVVYGKDDETTSENQFSREVYYDNATGASFPIPSKWIKDDSITDGYSNATGFKSPDETDIIVYLSKDIWGELDPLMQEMFITIGYDRSKFNSDLFSDDDMKELVSSMNKMYRVENAMFKNYGRNRYYIVNGSITNTDYMSNIDSIFNTRVTIACCIENGYYYGFVYSDGENSNYYTDFEMILEQFVPPFQN